jgi:hypothetical protein
VCAYQATDNLTALSKQSTATASTRVQIFAKKRLCGEGEYNFEQIYI